jgi:hypothetical protein
VLKHGHPSVEKKQTDVVPCPYRDCISPTFGLAHYPGKGHVMTVLCRSDVGRKRTSLVHKTIVEAYHAAGYVLDGGSPHPDEAIFGTQLVVTPLLWSAFS